MKQFIFLLLLILPVFAYAQVPGCTDPLATNYNTNATVNDGSCTYSSSSVSAASSINLPEIMEETSGLIYWDNRLWTHNDDADINLYAFQPENPSTYTAYELTGTINKDQEEISQDSTYIYLGDFGNNVSGNRTDLHILRIEKQSLLAGNPMIDTIWFSYSNQENLAAVEANKSDFDCEAFIVSSDSIYLFTKQWNSNKTASYSLSKYPGTHIAHYKGELNVSGLITGAYFNRSKKLVVLCGYSSLLQPFFYLLYDFQGSDFFSGNKRKISFSQALHQVEGITSENGLLYYVSNEKVVKIITINTKLHQVNLSSYLENYFNSLEIDNIQPEIYSLHSDTTIYVEENCYVLTPDFRTEILANDDITIAENIVFEQTPYPGAILTCGTHTIYLRAYDEADNFHEISFLINVIDTLPPTIIFNDNNFLVDADENCEITISNFTEQANIFDNCTSFADLEIVQEPEVGSVFSQDEIEASIKVTDEYGNENQINFIITKKDNIPPIIDFDDSNIFVDADENCEITIPDFTEQANIFDNCTSFADLEIVQDPEVGSVFSQNEIEVSIKATDEFGNENKINFIITKIDNILPNIECSSQISIVLDEEEVFYVVESTEFDPVFYEDNCADVSITNDYNNETSLAGEKFFKGNTVVKWTAKDANNNIAECELNISLSDLSIESVQVSGIKIFPNPVNNFINILNPNYTISNIYLSDINGKIIELKSTIEKDLIIFDVSSLTEGIYFINITTTDFIVKRKFIKL